MYKMKKMWNEPSIMVQEFTPNEYVAACYMLACGRGPNDDMPYGSHWQYKQTEGPGSHSASGTPGTCADPSANRVITSDGGVFSSVGELNGEQGWLNGGLDHIIQMDGNSTVDPGDVIFWHTEVGNWWNKRRWNHWGVVQQQDPNHPNHS